jgi:hypothetical protein
MTIILEIDRFMDQVWVTKLITRLILLIQVTDSISRQYSLIYTVLDYFKWQLAVMTLSRIALIGFIYA